ncbi:MAG TPA: nitroreductase/quinone reductase family protein [Streptosporangiaceae bacterium]|jgi:deazaflavin-dependent oxidoreductase (nitroreductase family)
MRAESKRRYVTWVHRRINPIVRRLAPYIPGQAVIETTGRRTGLTRRNPVGGRRVGRSFWLVSEHGMASGYVRNIAADPRVRVQLNGRWYTGTAHLLPDDDPGQRLRELPWSNSVMVRLAGTGLLTVRIDLDGPAT